MTIKETRVIIIDRDLQIKVKPQSSEFTNNSQDKKWHDKKAASNLKKRSSLMKRCVETLRRIQNLIHFGIVYSQEFVCSSNSV